MNTLKLLSFTTHNTFLGGVLDEFGVVQNLRNYRFRITQNQMSSFNCTPESYYESKDIWVSTSMGWYLEDVIDCERIFVDFGSNKVILPTQDVWNEIRVVLYKSMK